MKLPTDYQTFIHLSRYARWCPIKGRREKWSETVERYVMFLALHARDNLDAKLSQHTIKKIKNEILSLNVMPSMRAMMTAGEALARDHAAGYNCCYLAVDHPYAFDEAMYLLMCGCGVGFSVEQKCIDELPEIPRNFRQTEHIIKVEDSRIGWAKAFREVIGLLYNGVVPNIDYSELRPEGAPLITFGGSSSGPEPLRKLFENVKAKFSGARGRKLYPIECHDIMCMIGDIVVVGGVRRSAMISLFSDNGENQYQYDKDQSVFGSKTGNWHEKHPYRRLANNSMVIFDDPGFTWFMCHEYWDMLEEERCGEPGFFNRKAAKIQCVKADRDYCHDMGTNPCSEIILRPCQMCNLTEVVVRPGDSIEDLRKKIEVATILGTLQSTFTDFRYLRKIWKQNCEEERLLGVSLTGIYDHEVLSSPEHSPVLLRNLREKAQSTNAKWAEKIGINKSAAITCVKPSGTVSQLVDSSSGIHPRYAGKYKRSVLLSKSDPVFQFMKDSGFPYEDSIHDEKSALFSFPIMSPEESTTRDRVSAIEQLELWKVYQDHWCDHKPSCTVYVKGPEEWIKVRDWVWRYSDTVSGIAFLPYSDHKYEQAPYQELSEEEYEKLCSQMPESVDWGKLKKYEEKDNTVSSQEFACVGGSCEL